MDKKKKKIIQASGCLICLIIAIIVMIPIAEFTFLIGAMGTDSPNATGNSIIVAVLIIFYLIIQAAAIIIAAWFPGKVTLTLIFLPVLIAVYVYFFSPAFSEVRGWSAQAARKEETYKKKYDAFYRRNDNLLNAIKNSNFDKADSLIKEDAFLPVDFKKFSLQNFNKEQQLFILNKCYDNNGYTFLGSFIENEQTNSEFQFLQHISQMLEEGANPDFASNSSIKSNGGYDWTAGSRSTPLGLACEINNKSLALKTAALLLEYGADINKQSGFSKMTPIMIAAVEGDKELVMFLASKDADLNKTDSYGKNIFCPLIRELDYSMLAFLFKNLNADINHRNNNGETPIYQLIFTDNRIDKNNPVKIEDYKRKLSKVLDLLVKNGALLNIEDNDKMTLLGSSIENHNNYFTQSLNRK